MLLEPKPDALVRRERLVELFWPDVDRRKALASLRQSLAYLRQSLPEGSFEREGNRAVGVSFDHVTCDAVRFEAFLEEGRRADALALYRGDLLDGFLVDAGEAFERWLEARRAELRGRAAEASWALAFDAEQEGHGTEAAFWGKRALALSPFEESEVRRLLGLLARIGDRAGALRVYRGLESALEREGREPDALTRRIAEEIWKLDPEDPGTRLTHGGGRRSGVDRRTGDDRRSGNGGRWSEPERRSGRDRRSEGERRSGGDRRGPG